jgi:hypothetical protein
LKINIFKANEKAVQNKPMEVEIADSSRLAGLTPITIDEKCFFAV